MTDSSPLESRLMEVEMQLMHLQHEHDQLNAECLKQQSLLADQTRRVERLENLLQRLLGGLDSSESDPVN